MSARRSAHALVAVLALIGIAINFAVMHGDMLPRLTRFLSFFTILSNGLLAIVALGIACERAWALDPATRAAVSLYISVVAAIFQLLLAGLVPLSPLGWWGNMLVHQLVPAMWLACWIGFGPHGGIAPRRPLAWLTFPALYGAWTIAHGAASGWYPYPFLNVAKFGGAAVANNMAGMGIFFLLLGYLYRWIDARLARRAP